MTGMKTYFLLSMLILTTLSQSCTNRPKVFNEYYPDGIIKKETEMKDGLPNGMIRTYDERGRLKSTATVVNGLYEGWMTTYNPANNKITAKAFYKNDQQNGPVTLYYNTGELYREETYTDGRVDGLVKTYWANGNLQAEVGFKMGMPAIGLKEYDQEGNPITQPFLVIEELNQLSYSNTFKLKVYLSDRRAEVDFYEGELINDTYLSPNAVKIRDAKGVALLQYNVLKNHKMVKRVAISARTRTKNGNTLLLHKVYNLNISN